MIDEDGCVKIVTSEESTVKDGLKPSFILKAGYKKWF